MAEFSSCQARVRSVWSVVALVLLLVPSISSATPITLYNVTPIPSVPNGQSMYVSGINNAGQVVGSQYIDEANVGAPHAFLFSGGTTTPVVPLTNASSGVAINDFGVVVGNSTFSTDLTGQRRAFTYDGTLRQLDTPSGNATATAINNAGQIVVDVQNSGFSRAYFFDGTIHDLGVLNAGDNNVVANDINNSGLVVGSSSSYSGGHATGEAVLYDGTMHGLGTLPGFAQSEATAINDIGQIVGFSFNPMAGPANAYRAFIYDGAMHDLGASGLQSIAEDINASGVVVGEAYFESKGWHAFVYNGGVVHDLNDFLGTSGIGWTIDFATGVNDAGQIAVYGFDSSTGEQRGAILTPCLTCEPRPIPSAPNPNPIPEPGSLVLCGIGLGYLARLRSQARFGGHNAPGHTKQ